MNLRRFSFPVLMLGLLVFIASPEVRSADPESGAYVPDAQAQPEIVTGEVISLCNYLAKGHLGDEHAEEGQFLVQDRGLPVAILGEDGQIYIAILKGFKSAKEKLAPMLGKKVNARGVVRRHPGANLIEVQIVSEALD